MGKPKSQERQGPGWLTAGINLTVAMLALVISSISVYYQFFEVKHELRVSVLSAHVGDENHLKISLLVVNNGNRPVNISAIRGRCQLDASSFFTHSSDTTIIYPISRGFYVTFGTDFKSSVYKPGEMKRINLDEPLLVKPISLLKTNDDFIPLPLSLRIHFINPQGTSSFTEIEIGELRIGKNVTLSEFEQKSFNLFNM